MLFIGAIAGGDFAFSTLRVEQFSIFLGAISVVRGLAQPLLQMSNTKVPRSDERNLGVSLI